MMGFYCWRIKKNIEDVVKKNLSEEELAKVHKHITDCHQCRVEYNQTRMLVDELKKLRVAKLPKAIDWPKVLNIGSQR